MDSMEKSSIVIIGLGRVGSDFLEHFLNLSNLGISIIGVVEPLDNIGRRKAQGVGITLLELDQVIEFGDEVDFIFDFTGVPSFQKELMQKLTNADNQHTEVSSGKTLKMIWRIMTDEPIPLRI